MPFFHIKITAFSSFCLPEMTHKLQTNCDNCTVWINCDHFTVGMPKIHHLLVRILLAFHDQVYTENFLEQLVFSASIKTPVSRGLLA